MLIKKELLTISKDIPVQIVDLPKSGKVLAVKLNTIGGKPCTFYSDSKSYIYHYDGEWTRRQIIEFLSAYSQPQWIDKEINENPGMKALVKEFLNNTDTWSDKVSDSISSFTYHYNTDRRWEARLKSVEQQKKHLAMFPPLPADFYDWCEKELMKGCYLFFSNKEKGEREVYCTSCRTQYKETENIRHKTEGQCRHCGAHATYFAKRYHYSIEEGHIATICSKNEDTMLFDTRRVYRRFNEELEPVYGTDTVENILLFPPDARYRLYRYQYKAYRGHEDWYRTIGQLSMWQSKLYDRNLAKVLPNRYAQDVFWVLANYTGEIKPVNLIINLETIPQTEYLLKMRLVRLAAGAENIKFQNGRGFSGVMGVPGHYKDMYRALDISVSEHNMLYKLNIPVNESQIILMRKYELSVSYLIEELTNKYGISIDKILNYLKKQMKFFKDSTMNSTARFWIDYLDMAERENVLTSASKFPADLKKEHHLLVDMINARKDRELAEKRRKEAEEAAGRNAAFEKVAARCQNMKYIIQIAKTSDELQQEGQALHHCVGNGTYWNRHVKGMSLICFIRRKQEPDTPYFTLEVNLNEDKYTIAQLYGYGDCLASEEIRRFAQRFVNMIQPKEALQPTGT